MRQITPSVLRTLADGIERGNKSAISLACVYSQAGQWREMALSLALQDKARAIEVAKRLGLEDQLQ